MGSANQKPSVLFSHVYLPATRLAVALGTAAALTASGSAADADVPGSVPTRPATVGLVPGTVILPPGGGRALTAPHHGAATRKRPAATPVLDQIAQQEVAAEAVAERITEARIALGVARARLAAATARLATATTNATAARSAAASWARESFIAEASRPPDLVDDPRTAMLGRPGLPRIDTPTLRLELAESTHQQAARAATSASASVTTQQRHLATLQAELASRGRALRRLRSAHASALAAAQRRRDARNAALVGTYLRDADGLAGRAALAAVGFALSQRGKSYEWGAEGPDRYDCSGLVQTAYATVDVPLPRTARPQYRASQPVPVRALLPGDLLFFATDQTDWNTIHHVGVYLGRGLMVHAPTTGDVVRVAPVWWSEFFAAGRVVAGRPNRRGHRSPVPSRPAQRSTPPDRSRPDRSGPDRSRPPTASAAPPTRQAPDPAAPSAAPSGAASSKTAASKTADDSPTASPATPPTTPPADDRPGKPAANRTGHTHPTSDGSHDGP